MRSLWWRLRSIGGDRREVSHFGLNSDLVQMVDDKGFLKDELSNDGLHPNPQGYVVMAPLAEAAIAVSLKHK